MLTATVTDTETRSSATLGAAEAGLGQQDFLRMLIAQLENQDPLNPQESTEFTAQLAQFSSLEQEIAMRDSLDSIRAALGRADSVTAIGMIGQEVLAEGDQFELGSDGATLKFELAGASDSTQLKVVDADGNTVASIEAGPLSPGLHGFVWDGTGSNQQPLPPGVYQLTVAASHEERPIGATPLVAGRVSGADVSGQTPMLILGDMIVPLSSVREVFASQSSQVQP